MPLVAASLAAAILVVAQVPSVIDAFSRGPGLGVWSVVTLLAAALIVLDAVRWALRETISDGGAMPSGPAALWLGMAITAGIAWTDALYPAARPLHSLAFFAILAAYPAALAERAPLESRVAAFAATWRRAAVAVGLAAAFAAALRHAVTMRPAIEGIDFFVNITVARDLVHGFADVPLNRYRYFPGVYMFWRAAIDVAGESLARLQWVFIAVLVANAATVGAIVARVGASVPAALFSAAAYLLLAGDFEAFHAATEAIVTLPALVAVLVWAGAPLAGRRGLWRTIALGVGLGLAVYAKQQGGLVTLGWLAIVALAVVDRADARYPLERVVAIPPVALATLALGIAVERRGLEPVRRGLAWTLGYEGTGDWISNAATALVRDEPLTVAAAVAALAWVVALLVPAVRSVFGPRALAVVGFSAVAGVAALAQFSKRGYLHYALLALPFFIVAIVLVALDLLRWSEARGWRGPLVAFAVVGVAGLSLAQPEAGHLRPAIWPLHAIVGTGPPPHPWRERPDVAADLAVLRSHVRPSDDVLVLPPRRIEVHWALGTRTRTFQHGYAWEGGESRPPPRERALAAIAAPSLDAVIVLNGPLEPDDWSGWEWTRGDVLRRALASHGFVPVVVRPTMTLWRRPRS